jgi:hypothetical protein
MNAWVAGRKEGGGGKGKKEGKKNPLSKLFLPFYYHVLFSFCDCFL